MRKFYSVVSIVPVEEGHCVGLDGKPVKTPGKRPLLLATPALAEAIASEWRAQDAFIVPATMKLTQLASTAIDRVAPNRAAVIDGLVGYAATDLVCYRATEPAELVAEQAALFDPLLNWLEERTGQALVIARGIMPVRQPEPALEAVRSILFGKTAEQLTAIQLAAALASSLTIALTLVEGRLNAATAFTTANVEELYQISKWGEDEDARERLDAVKGEFETLEQFTRLLQG